ncbi:hypothetical protein [Gottfriedia acidiceleris]|uniref:hypothetical protein n=1 Tax=Gottfriedia acidiceleris TaxID=371036 RepID=UPI002FFD8DB7
MKSGEKITARVGKGTWIDNKNKGKMSEFSSLGAPHTLDFKPEISAPGGKIYSTVVNNKDNIFKEISNIFRDNDPKFYKKFVYLTVKN